VNANDHKSKKPAKVGSSKTTTTPKEYPYPGEGKISLWDIPGIGLSAAPDVKTYCDEFKILQHDAFVIMTAKSLSQLNISLAEKLANIKKPFLFVRARIDEDFANDNKNTIVSRDEFRKKIETEFREEVAQVDKIIGRNLDIFLINNDNPSDWDFSKLVLAIGKQFSLDQQQCFHFTQPAISKEILKEKVKELK
ncbi:interferon-inducible GTPase 5-like, partial [Paramuricea clavata]